MIDVLNRRCPLSDLVSVSRTPDFGAWTQPGLYDTSGLSGLERSFAAIPESETRFLLGALSSDVSAKDPWYRRPSCRSVFAARGGEIYAIYHNFGRNIVFIFIEL